MSSSFVKVFTPCCFFFGVGIKPWPIFKQQNQLVYLVPEKTRNHVILDLLKIFQRISFIFQHIAFEKVALSRCAHAWKFIEIGTWNILHFKCTRYAFNGQISLGNENLHIEISNFPYSFSLKFSSCFNFPLIQPHLD